jgi:hypothetical protein
MARAYSHHGHGPCADRKGRIHISDFRKPAKLSLAKRSRSIHLGDFETQTAERSVFIQSAEKEFTEFFDKGKYDADTLYSRIRRVMNWRLGRLRKNIKDIENRYRNELALLIPVTYWQKKYEDHKESGIIWGSIIVLGVAIFLIFSYVNANFIRDFILPRDDVNPAAGIAVLVAGLFFVVWVLRLIARQIVTNVSLMHDAAERKTMTETFLALMDEHGHVTEQDRVLILHALFRPSTTGQSEDAAPPHWFDMLMERYRKA